MLRRIGWGTLGLVLALGIAPARGDDGPLEKLVAAARALIEPQGPKIVAIAGRVVDAEGKPVAGVRVGREWTFGARPEDADIDDGATTDAEGRFTLDEVPVWPKHRTAVVALDPVGKTGGSALVAAATAGEPVEIRLVPLIRVRTRVESADPAHPLWVARCRVLLDVAGQEHDADVGMGENFGRDDPAGDEPIKTAAFVLMLPPGRYNIQAQEPTDPNFHLGVAKMVDVRADQPRGELDLDLPLPLSPLAKAADWPSPPLHVRATRGVAADVKLTDYQGKWVVLEFWAHWCGPCVGRGIPQVVRFAEDHADARDRFVVLTVHSSDDAPNFAHIDRKMAPIVRKLWDGQPLPFPVLIDDDGRTAAAYGIEGIPRTIVINPAGRIAPGGLEELSEALPTIPMDLRIARALDRPIPQPLVSALGSGWPLGDLFRQLTMSEIELTPDADALKRAGVPLTTEVPICLLGSISLRSALRLILEPLGLVAVPDSKGLTVTTPPGSASPPPTPTAAQIHAADRLRRVLGEPVRCDYRNKPLAEVADALSNQANVPIVLDPAERRSGRLDPKQVTTASGSGTSLESTLRAWLDPVGLTYQVRDDVILIRRP